jgi:hypothetical protein
MSENYEIISYTPDVEGNLDEKSNVHSIHIANSDKPVMFYSSDVILEV